MAKNFFQDMVKIKKAGNLKPQPDPEPVLRPQTAPSISQEPKKDIIESPSIPLSTPPLTPTPPPIPESVLARQSESAEDKFASVYEVGHKGQNGGKSSSLLWLLAGISVAGLLFALSFLFSEVKVTINPKIQDVSLNKNFFAVKSPTVNDLAFDLIIISGEENTTIEGKEEKEVLNSAEGVAIVFNTFSSATQRLDIDTRLEGSNGKIYKTKKQITVPGIQSDGTPGSVEVGIYASSPGEEYNSAPLDFTIVGFKGTPKYSKFFARSKGEITGGLSGKFKTTSPSEEQSILNELHVKLEEQLLQKASGSIPAGFILFADATSLSIDSQKIEPASLETGMVSISIRGTLYGFLFDEAKLTKKITETSVSQYDGSEVYIPNVRELAFAIYNQDALSPPNVKNITFNLLGDLKIVWKLDEEKFISSIVSRKKDEFNQILSTYPNIISANVVFNPFWRRSFPEKAKDIKLIVNYPE